MTHNIQKFKISQKEAGERLDKFLISKFSELSRSKIQKIIEKGNVSIKPLDSATLRSGTKNYRLKTGDIIIITLKKEKPFQLKPNPDLAVPIIFENENYLIVDKPAGLVVHPGEGHLKQDTLVNWLIAKYPKIQKIEPDSLRPGIVHRLDKETSGIMIIAKTNKFYKHIREQFDNRKVKKTYLAWVKGEVKKEKETISKPLKRGKGFKWIVAKEGLEAITKFKVLKREKNKTLLKVNPITGRMHQIRVHLKSIGHPIIGDTIYGKDKQGPLLLRAYKIKFKDIDGKTKEFEISY